VPAGTPSNVKRSERGNENEPDDVPVTSRMMPMGVAPADGFSQPRKSVDPLARPRRPVGADGGGGTATLMTISLDGRLLTSPTVACKRTKKTPVGAGNVTVVAEP
jgi:hypothetical protein